MTQTLRNPHREDGRRLRLLVISPGGLGLHYHGPAISMFRLLGRLRDRLTVDVVHGSSAQGDIAPLEGRAIKVGDAGSHFRSSLGYMVGAVFHIIRNRREYDTVLLVSLNLLTLVPGAIARLLGMRVVARAAAIAEATTGTGGSIGQAIKRKLMRQASAFWAISGSIAAELERAGGGAIPVHDVPNSVDTKRFHSVDEGQARQLAADLGLNPAPGLRLVCVGAMGERKGQHLVVEAMSMLPDNVVLTMFGPFKDTGYERRIAALVEQHELSHRVDHVPFMEDVEKAYATGQIYLLPSVGEGMPNGMLEAMASGLVPVGTRVSGIEDLIEDGCGCFVERDAESIAAAIRVYLDNPEKLAQERSVAREKIMTSFDSAFIRERVFQLLSVGRS